MNMKKFLSTVLVIASLLVFTGSTIFAQNQYVLPKAGLTPENPFYFLDRLGEALREFFTFNPEGKARLQVTFAAERVAEIKVILEAKGVEAKGLKIAQSRLQAHLAHAAAIVAEQKEKGKDVSTLAKELVDGLEAPISALADSFKEQKRPFKAKEDDLKAQLKAGYLSGDAARIEALAQELGQVKAQLGLLELKEEELEDQLEAEEEKLEQELQIQHKAEKAIREAEKEKEELIDQAAEEGVQLPANAFAEFDDLLSSAKSALAAGDFLEAKRLAKQAEKNLEAAKKGIDELDDWVLEDCVCIMVYAPVCGVDGKTYGNECLAGCEKIKVAYRGECREENENDKRN
jgi:hypothetical protein